MSTDPSTSPAETAPGSHPDTAASASAPEQRPASVPAPEQRPESIPTPDQRRDPNPVPDQRPDQRPEPAPTPERPPATPHPERSRPSLGEWIGSKIGADWAAVIVAAVLVLLAVSGALPAIPFLVK